MKALNCPNCGAALPAQSINLEIVVCEFCRTSIRLTQPSLSLPNSGEMVAVAESNAGTLAGWDFLNEKHLVVSKTEPLELHAKFQGSPTGAYYILRSTKFLSDFDIQTDITFTGGVKEIVRAGVYLRFADAGGYAFLISAQATYTYGYFEKQEKNSFMWKPVQPWTQSASMNLGFNRVNRLRVVCRGDTFQMYLNDMLADSFSDSRYTTGRACVTLDPGEWGESSFKISRLQVRELSG
jgi:hypothetical protein